MEDRAHAVEGDTDPRATALGQLGANRREQRFDVTPRDVGSLRRLEDPLQGTSLPGCHGQMISTDDTIVKSDVLDEHDVRLSARYAERLGRQLQRRAPAGAWPAGCPRWFEDEAVEGGTQGADEATGGPEPLSAACPYQ